jgi:transposase-like protein
VRSEVVADKPGLIECPRCYQGGFVRVETISKDGHRFRTLSCQSCGYAWVTDEPSRRRTSEDDSK